MKYQAVLFDFDGTLANTNQVVIDSWQHTYLARWGRKEEEAEIIKSFGEPLADTMARIFPEYDLEETLSIYRDFQREIFGDVIGPFEGMVEAVKALKAQGIKVGIVTSRMISSTTVGLKAFGIYEDMDVIVTCEDTDAHKPDPEPIFIALNKLEIEPKDALMIGDSVLDLGCAGNAGVDSVLVDWTVTIEDYRSLTGVEAPTYYIKEASEIVEIAKGN